MKESVGMGLGVSRAGGGAMTVAADDDDAW
jgi:hypothetical protein